ncbi:hypothetical protein BK658_28595 [Pseudomonas brassicacearum]|uniref:Transposase IS66 C-terminal domain-containing protein n=1 Tax=Pseudomonas brassicacearum TaxID=930166 RepID=A0A423GIB6_9PSED|nr:hypothetical protein BK658_28595 [Pseudomonas brassicacearum]
MNHRIQNDEKRQECTLISRKNWLFNDKPKDAAASAQIYSLVKTAKANGQEPYSWLSHMLERLRRTHSAVKGMKCYSPGTGGHHVYQY